MAKKYMKKKTNIQCRKGIIISKSSNKEKVTVAICSPRKECSEIISVPQYRKIAKTELLDDEVIIKNIVERRISRALWEKLARKIRKTCYSDERNNSIRVISVKSGG